MSEEENIVKIRDGVFNLVVTNINSTSNERYIVKGDQFSKTYVPTGDGLYTPAFEPRTIARVNENVLIMTTWGAPALCLAWSYIVTYDADINDYNTLEQSAYESTYAPVSDVSLARRKPTNPNC